MEENLVIVRCGGKSLHSTWLGDLEERNWDLFLCPYQPVHAAAKAGVAAGDVLEGQKWAGLARLLQQRGKNVPDWRRYRYVWLPDDDLVLKQSDINELFGIAARLDAKLCAPALHPESYFSHLITMANKSFTARRTDFVEVMMPCFRSDVLERLLETFSLSETGLGWGLDFLWPHILDFQNVFIIDAVLALHVRPVHQHRSSDLTKRANDEMNTILTSYNARVRWNVFGGHDELYEYISAIEPSFLYKLINGWSYLFRRRPELMGKLLFDQGYRLETS